MRFLRNEMLLGPAACKLLFQKHVTVFGLGGVGAAACEGIVRAGIGTITIIDNDRISESNCNRQLIALSSTIGKLKTEVLATRLKDINPDVLVHTHTAFITDNAKDYIAGDYVIDAVDTVTAKLSIISACNNMNIPVISCMGTGNRFDPSCLRITKIAKTSGCPLAKVMRKELKTRKIYNLDVVFSTELPAKAASSHESDQIEKTAGRHIPASSPFVPPAAGFLAASFVTRQLLTQ